jgi:RNA polymerase sigma factor (sigma-70 family)
VNPTPIPATVEDLAAHLAWARRLAARLVRDSAEAEDVVQDAWITGWKKPPAADRPLRPWLGQVVLNRVRNRVRGQRRRGARELGAEVVSAPASVPTPEELTSRLELQRTLAQQLMALSEPYWQVLYLSFYEGLDATALGARLGVPPGTVRWRLKMGIDQIRARLDAEHGGDRKRWQRLLIPFAGVRSRPSLLLRPLVAIPIAAILLLGLAGLFEWRRRAALQTQRHLDQVAQLPAVAPPLPPPGPPSFFAGAATDPAAGTSCPEVEPFRRETAALRRELHPYLSADTILAESPPNPELERRFGAVLAAALDKVGECGHRLECRGDACRLTMLIPLRLREESACLDRALRWHDYVGSRISGGSAEPAWDPVAKLPVARVVSRFRLVSPDATPIPFERQPAKPPLTIVRHRPPPPPPRDAGPACRAAYQLALSERRAIEAVADRDLDEDVAFETNAPSPPSTAEAVRHVERVLGTDLASRLQVECRGVVCRVTRRDPADPLTAIPWDCQSPDLCLPTRDERVWFRRLAPWDDPNPFWIKVSRSPLRRGDVETPPHYRLAPGEDRDKPDAMTVLRQFTDPLKQSGLFQSCERRFPATGRLALTIRLTRPDEQGKSHIEVHHGEALGGSPLARCIIEGFDAALATFVVPPHRGSAVIKAELDFPGARQRGR